MDNKNSNKTFLGLLYIIKELLDKQVLHYDPNNNNNMIMWYSGDENQPEGWYSVNIMGNVSDLFHDKEQMEYVLSVAVEHGVDIEKLFADANMLLGK